MPTEPAFDAPLGGPYWNTAMTFVMKKLEWCGYPTVKKFEDMFIRLDRVHERDRRTDTARRHMPQLHSIMWQKC